LTALPVKKIFDQTKSFFLDFPRNVPSPSFFFEFSSPKNTLHFVLKMARPRKDSWAAVVTTAAKKAISKKKSVKSNKSGGETDDLFDGYSGMAAFDAQRQRGQEQRQHQHQQQFQQTAEEEEALNNADSSLKQILTQRLEGRVGGPTRRSAKGGWTPAEDDVLRRAVAIYKGKNWKKIGAFEYIFISRARREKKPWIEKSAFF
jgi:uncharacterized protein YdbL (DUF1318 family)